MKRATFFMFWLVISTATYVTLSFAGAVPAEIEIFNGRIVGMFERAVGVSVPLQAQGQVVSVEGLSTASVSDLESILPERVIIQRIGVNSPVLNPESTEIAVLDKALSKGVVRYPGSGGLGDKRNMFLFGHSTSLRDVRNLSYQAFNGLEKLVLGDVIEVWSGSTGYMYQVNAIYQTDQNKTMVEFGADESMITISTCDSFGSKSDRIVVEAKLVETLP